MGCLEPKSVHLKIKNSFKENICFIHEQNKTWEFHFTFNLQHIFGENETHHCVYIFQSYLSENVENIKMNLKSLRAKELTRTTSAYILIVELLIVPCN